MATNVVEAFSVTHAQIMDGATAFDAVVSSLLDGGDIYGVEKASLTTNKQVFDNKGDDAILSSWPYMEKGELTVEAGWISFAAITLMTGVTATASGAAAPNDKISFEMWHEDSFNAPPAPVALILPSKDRDGNTRRLILGIYRVQFDPVGFVTGPAYKEGLKVSYGGQMVGSRVDEQGNTFADGKLHFARVISMI